MPTAISSPGNGNQVLSLTHLPGIRQRTKLRLALLVAGWLALLPGTLLAAEGNASRINELLTTLRSPAGSGSPTQYRVLEEDVNAWAVVAIQGKKRLGIRTLKVDFLGLNRLQALAEVDMDQVQLEGFSVQLFKSALSGVQLLVAEGRIVAEGRKVFFEVENASVNGIPVPGWLVTQVLSYLSSRQPPNIDVTQPFDLPYGIRDVQLLTEHAVITR